MEETMGPSGTESIGLEDATKGISNVEIDLGHDCTVAHPSTTRYAIHGLCQHDPFSHIVLEMTPTPVAHVPYLGPCTARPMAPWTICLSLGLSMWANTARLATRVMPNGPYHLQAVLCWPGWAACLDSKSCNGSCKAGL
uniref:Uncharacterized protein n=1 Tax=Oryza punctata TaxID=4537 RepID=A0A0E0M5I1_ORYPU